LQGCIVTAKAAYIQAKTNAEIPTKNESPF
jgi:hypothetical protein